MTTAARPRVSATQAKILADLKRFGAGGPVARVYTETVGLREDIAQAIRLGVPLDAIVQSVATRCEVDRRSAIEGLRQSLDGLGLDLSLPRGHRPKSDSLRGDLAAAAAPRPVPPTPTSGAKKANAPHSPAVAPGAVPAVPPPTPTPTPTRSPAPQASAQSTPTSPAPFPEIPRGELTHTERAEIAKKWIASQFGDKHPTQVRPDELTPAAQEWLEKLWDKPAPVNPKTGQPYSFKRFTPDGRLTYNEPWWPPEAVVVEDDEYGDGYVSVHDAATRETIKKYKLRLIAKGKPPYLELWVQMPDGRSGGAPFLRTDAACLGRVARDCAWDIEERRRKGLT